MKILANVEFHCRTGVSNSAPDGSFPTFARRPETLPGGILSGTLFQAGRLGNKCNMVRCTHRSKKTRLHGQLRAAPPG
jgi:hypothetical protein